MSCHLVFSLFKLNDTFFILCFFCFFPAIESILYHVPHTWGTYRSGRFVQCYTPTQRPPRIYVKGKRPDVQVYTCTDKCPTFNNMHQATPLVTGLNQPHAMCLTQLKNRSLFWHPELSPFLWSVSLLVIIALTLNVKEINLNDFFKVNGCKESKRGRKILARLSLSPLCMKGKGKLKCRAQLYPSSAWTAAAKPAR